MKASDPATNRGRWELALPVPVPRREVERLLGLVRGPRPPRPNLARGIAASIEEGAGLLTPRALVAELPDGLEGSLFLPRGPLAVAVCTVGPALGERAAACARAGEVTRAMLLDAVGSAAVEALADRVNEEVCARALDAGRRPGPRRSPGYGGWDLDEQRLIFDALAPGGIGVSLTASCLMRPIKSISFAVSLEEGGGGRDRGRCERCERTDCAFREPPDGGQLPG